MTDAEILLAWLNGARIPTLSEALLLAGKGFLRFRTDDTVTMITPEGEKSSKHRRLFRPKGSPATGGEILNAVKGGVIPFNRELSSQLAKDGLVSEKPVSRTLEITASGKALIHSTYPNIREIRNVYGSEILY